jgi:hypothetical protein
VNGTALIAPAPCCCSPARRRPQRRRRSAERTGRSLIGDLGLARTPTIKRAFGGRATARIPIVRAHDGKVSVLVLRIGAAGE